MEIQARQLLQRTTHPDAQWFPQKRMGLFMHWGIGSVAGLQPSWAMIKDYRAGGNNAYPPHRYYGLANQFNPKHYDPEKWMSAAKDAGFSYAVLTTKHHDGYTLWPSEHGYLGTAQYMGGTDLVGKYVEACRNTGMKVGLYFSWVDWHHPMWPQVYPLFDHAARGNKPPQVPREEEEANFAAFYRFAMSQIDELLTRYGKIDLFFIDGGGLWGGPGTPQFLRTEETIAHIRTLQPGIVINNRWADDGAYGDYLTPEGRVPEKRFEDWWEVCLCTNEKEGWGNWGYTEGVPLPDVSWFVEMRKRINDGGGNFLPNIGPGPDGTMPDDFYTVCKALKQDGR